MKPITERPPSTHRSRDCQASPGQATGRACPEATGRACPEATGGRRLPRAALALGVVAAALWSLWLAQAPWPSHAARFVGAAAPGVRLYLPLVARQRPPSSLDRLGLAVTSGSFTQCPLDRTPFGWYADYAVRVTPSLAGNTEYMQTVFVRETHYPPDWDLLRRAARANPGALWKVGNEPECVWQGDRTPEEYAVIYHEVYTFLKGVDPTARVAIGSVVQPTPLRLEWLDRVRAAYAARYGTTLPVDVWNIHNLVLQEKYDDYGCGIPAGLSATEGRLYPWWQHDDIDIFIQHVYDFRRWMAERGERDKPLIISEFGILYPSSWYDGLGDGRTGDQRVNDFMEATYTFLLTAEDPDLGYPADGNRLVQRWLWFSLDHVSWDQTAGLGFNGNLCDPHTRELTTFGLFYEQLVQRLRREHAR